MPTMTFDADQFRLTPRSVLRYRPLAPTDIPPWVSPGKGDEPPAIVLKQQSRHWSIYVCTGMIVTFFLIVLSNALWTIAINQWNTIHYGMPRTFHIDAVVGHQDSPAHPSHFLAMNNHGRIEIIEIPGNDPEHPHMYFGPQFLSSDDELVPVTLSFVPHSQAGYPDMLLHVQETTFTFINTGSTFESKAS